MPFRKHTVGGSPGKKIKPISLRRANTMWFFFSYRSSALSALRFLVGFFYSQKRWIFPNATKNPGRNSNWISPLRWLSMAAAKLVDRRQPAHLIISGCSGTTLRQTTLQTRWLPCIFHNRAFSPAALSWIAGNAPLQLLNERFDGHGRQFTVGSLEPLPLVPESVAPLQIQTFFPPFSFPTAHANGATRTGLGANELPGKWKVYSSN